MDKMTETIDVYMKKLPPLPVNIKDIIVKFAPWAAIITIVIGLPALLAIFGLGSYINSFGMGGLYYANLGSGYMFALLFLAAELVLRGLSVPGLFARSKGGWNLMYYSVLLYAVYSLVSFDIIGGLISTVISLYLLFQV